MTPGRNLDDEELIRCTARALMRVRGGAGGKGTYLSALKAEMCRRPGLREPFGDGDYCVDRDVWAAVQRQAQEHGGYL